MKNFYIDALDEIVSQTDPNLRWDAAVRYSQKIGAKSLLVAKLNKRIRTLDWANTNMGDDWMQEYLYNNYFEVDPLVPHAGVFTGTTAIETGTKARSNVESQKDYELDHGLKSAGYNSFFCSRFSGDDAFGSAVSFSFDEKLSPEMLSSDEHLRLLAALLAISIKDSQATATNEHLAEQRPQLTTRQKDVLCLLADGYQTARIAEKLKVTDATVSFHLANIRKTLRAKTREQALAIALKEGLISA